MTDADVAALAAEALSTPPDAAEEAKWRAEGLTALRTQEQRQMAEFKLARFLRDEANMKACAENLKKTRAAIGYLSDPDGLPEIGPT